MAQSRRSFLRKGGSAALAGGSLAGRGGAIEPIRRVGGARMKVSLAAYSFRQYLGGPARSMSYDQWVDLAAGYGTLDGIEPTAYYFPDEVDGAFLRGLRRRAFLRGLDISSTAIGNTFTHPAGPERDRQLDYTRRWVDRAAALGAPVIRIFAGVLQKGTLEADARRWAIDAIQECCRYAGDRGIMLALENHGGIVKTPDEMLPIVREVQSEWFGVNLDTGNFHGADPYADLERLAPYAVTVQVKTEISRGTGPNEPADLARVVDILKTAGYRGYLVLEYEAKEDPKTAVPRHLKELRGLIG